MRATLSATRPVESLTVRNRGTEAVVMQLEVMAWTQKNGKDVYRPTREILVTPPIFTVSAGSSQIVRVGLRRSPDARRELTYRLFLREVPPPPKPGFQGLQVALRIGVPVFVTPASGDAAPVLRWRATRVSGGAIRLAVANSGSAHVQIANFELALAGRNQPLVTLNVAAYILPGQSREWLVKVSPPSGSVLRLSARTDAGEFRTEVVVEEP